MCSTLLVIREMQIKTSSIDLTKFFKSVNTKCWQEHGKIVLSYAVALESTLTMSVKILNCFYPLPSNSTSKILS